MARRLAAEREESGRRHGAGVRLALGSRTVWQLGVLLLLCNAFGVYVLGLWLPQIVREVTRLGDFGVGLVTAVPNLVAAVAMVLVGAHSDRSGERLLHVAGCATAAAVGFAVSARLHSPVGVVLALSVAAAGLLASHGPFWPLPSSFLSGSAAAGGIALIASIANVAGFLGPYATGVLRGASGGFGTVSRCSGWCRSGVPPWPSGCGGMPCLRRRPIVGRDFTPPPGPPPAPPPRRPRPRVPCVPARSA